MKNKYREIKDPKSIIDAIERLIDWEKDCHIETHRVLNGGAFTRYEWALDENGDVELTYMDETIVIPRNEFEKRWKDEYAEGMYYPVPEDSDVLTVLGDGSSWVGGIGAHVYTVDPRYMETVCEGLEVNASGDEIDNLPEALVHKAHSLSELIVKEEVNPFNAEEQLMIHELARRALVDADNFDEMAYDMDVSDDVLKSLQEKLIAHLEGVSS